MSDKQKLAAGLWAAAILILAYDLVFADPFYLFIGIPCMVITSISAMVVLLRSDE